MSKFNRLIVKHKSSLAVVFNRKNDFQDPISNFHTFDTKSGMRVKL